MIGILPTHTSTLLLLLLASFLLSVWKDLVGAPGAEQKAYFRRNPGDLYTQWSFKEGLSGLCGDRLDNRGAQFKVRTPSCR